MSESKLQHIDAAGEDAALDNELMNKHAILGMFEGECADSNITNLNGMDITRPVWETVFASEEYKRAPELINESWRDVPEFEELYQVSNYGRVRSKDRIRQQQHRSGKIVEHLYRGQLIVLDYSTARFGSAHLYDKQHKADIPVYDLVCKVFDQNVADLFFYGCAFSEVTEDDVWAPVSDYPNYEISQTGKLRKKINSHYIVLHPDVSDYIYITLSRNNQQVTYPVHRLVAQAFIPNLDNKPYVNHIDGNKHNNNVENLEWVTASENMKHAAKTGLLTIDLERLAQARVLSTAKVKVPIFCPEVNMKFDSISAAAKYFNIDISKIAYSSLHGNKINELTFKRVIDL